MNLDDRICYCYHVSLRKLVNYARRERPARASGMSNCLGAGTGCGWCIPILKKVYQQALAGEAFAGEQPPAELPQNAEEYAAARQTYLKSDEKNAF